MPTYFFGTNSVVVLSPDCISLSIVCYVETVVLSTQIEFAQTASTACHIYVTGHFP